MQQSEQKVTVNHTLTFTDGRMLSMSPQDALSEVLDVLNSPVLFGCRTGICATCLVRVHAGMENLPPADENEQEVLEIYAEDQPDCRLACQLKLRGDVTLEYIGHG